MSPYVLISFLSAGFSFVNLKDKFLVWYFQLAIILLSVYFVCQLKLSDYFIYKYYFDAMPGTIIDVLVSAGEQVTGGQALIVMEAMKMEHTIKAHKKVVIAEVLYKVGDLVDDGAELIKFEDE